MNTTQLPQDWSAQRLRSSVSAYTLQREVLTAWARNSHADKTDLSQETRVATLEGQMWTKLLWMEPEPWDQKLEGWGQNKREASAVYEDISEAEMLVTSCPRFSFSS